MHIHWVFSQSHSKEGLQLLQLEAYGMFSERCVRLLRILCFIIYFTHLEPIFPGIYMTVLKHRLQAYGQLTTSYLCIIQIY